MSQLQEMQITSPTHFSQQQQQLSRHHIGSEPHLSDSIHNHMPYVSHGMFQTPNSPPQYNTITSSSLSEYCTPNWSPLSTSLIYNHSLLNNNNNNRGGGGYTDLIMEDLSSLQVII